MDISGSLLKKIASILLLAAFFATMPISYSVSEASLLGDVVGSIFSSRESSKPAKTGDVLKKTAPAYFEIQPSVTNGNRKIISKTFKVNKDSYTVVFGEAMDGQVNVLKNNKKIFSEQVMNYFIGDVHCYSMRGKIVFVCSAGGKIMHHPCAILMEDSKTGEMKVVLKSADFYNPDGYDCLGDYGMPQKFRGGNYSIPSDNCFILDFHILAGIPNTDITKCYFYLLDYNDSTDKFEYVEVGDGENFGPAQDRLHELSGHYEARAASAVINQHDKASNYDISYPVVRTGEGQADAAINADIMRFVQATKNVAKESQNAKMSYKLVSETPEYISIVFTCSRYTGGAKDTFAHFGIVYSKLNGQRIPLSNFTGCLNISNLTAQMKQYGLYKTDGSLMTKDAFLAWPDRVPDDYYITEDKKIFVLFQYYELTAFVYGVPGINVNNYLKENIDYRGNNAAATSGRRPTSAEIFMERVFN